MDMTDTMVTKIFMGLLPIAESSFSECRIAIFIEYKVVLHCKLAIEAIDFIGCCTVNRGYCSNQNGRNFRPFLAGDLNASVLVG